MDTIETKTFNSVKVVPVTPPGMRKYRGNDCMYQAPVVGNIVSVNGSGYGDGIHRTYVVIKVFKNRQGDVIRAHVFPVTNTESPLLKSDSSATYDPSRFEEIKCKFDHSNSHWVDDNPYNLWIFDR